MQRPPHQLGEPKRRPAEDVSRGERGKLERGREGTKKGHEPELTNNFYCIKDRIQKKKKSKKSKKQKKRTKIKHLTRGRTSKIIFNRGRITEHSKVWER